MMRTALAISKTAEDVCKALSPIDPYPLFNLFTTYGSIHRQSCRSQDGHDSYLKALEICLSAPESEERTGYLARAYGGLGNTALGLDDVTESIKYHEMGLAIRRPNSSRLNSNEDVYAFAVALINVGWAYWKSGQLDKASEVELEAIDLIEEIDRSSGKPSGR